MNLITVKKIIIIFLIVWTMILMLNKPNTIRLTNYNVIDSTNVWLKQRYLSDSILIYDLANLTTGEKHDEIMEIFKMNNRNVKSIVK